MENDPYVDVIDVHYQMIHAIGLVLVGLLSLYQRSRMFEVAGWAMLVGIILFPGFLFAWLATGRKFFVYPVPVGGIAFIVGWLALAIGSLGFRRLPCGKLVLARARLADHLPGDRAVHAAVGRVVPPPDRPGRGRSNRHSLRPLPLVS